MKRLLNSLIFCGLFALCWPASAEDLVGYLTDANGKYTGPSVEDNVALMDTDKNGFADVYEVRAFLELKHGKDYEKALLDRWQVAASGQSCGTSFAKELNSTQ